ncbi:MAG: isoprenylcysteine carboxylmethyltransferase family protein [bacterium]
MNLIILFSLIILLTFRFVRNRKTQNRKEGKAYSSQILTIQFLFYIILVLLVFLEFFLAQRRLNYSISILGFFIYILALIGREWAIKTLGEYWSADIRIKENHRLIKEGPYRYVRHPNLLSLLLETNALCLILNSYLCLLFVWLVYFPLILLRIKFEERVLVERLGSEYIEYRKKTRSLLPIVRRKNAH